MAKIAVRPIADADIIAIVGYLRTHAGEKVADLYRLDFRAVFRRLADHPESGAPRPVLGRRVRLVTIDPFVVLYRYDRARDTVFVLRVLHGRRQITLDAL